MNQLIHAELIGMGATEALKWARQHGKHLSFHANYAPLLPIPGRIYVEFGDNHLIINAFEVRGEP